MGRPSEAATRTATVLEAMENSQATNPHGHTSTAIVSRMTGIPKTSVWRSMRENGLRPYKIKRLQTLEPDDHPKRLAFAQWIQNNNDRLETIVWTDEACFSLDGPINRHNCVTWAHDNPRRIQTHCLHSPKLCVWMGFTAQFKLQPYFFPATINQENYGQLLKDHVFPQLFNDDRTLTFQHDGAPPHYALSVRQILAAKFDQNHVIGRGYGIPWPPRSPDLSPVDFYLWGALKARVFHHFIPDNLDSLQQKIVEAWNDVAVDELTRAVHHLETRAETVISQNGGNIEQLL